MKKRYYTVMALVLILVLSAAATIIYSREKAVTVYKENQEKVIKAKDLKNLLADGWSEEEVFRIYSKSGEEEVVTEEEFIEYDKEQWGKEPYVILYSVKGETVYAPESMVEEYLAVGWLLDKTEWEGLSDLKAQIENYLSSQSGSWGVFIQNLQNLEYLSVNEKPFSSASLIKIYTMAAVYNEIEKGNLQKNDYVLEQLNSMITVSSNAACNNLTKMVGMGSETGGFDRENELTKALGCSHTVRGSYLVEEGSGKKGAFRTYNTTSPRDCGKILRAIYEKTLVSETASEEMLNLLLAQTRTWKIPASLPEGTKVANKTGETNSANSDIAIVFSPEADYIICVLGNGNGLGVGPIHTISKRAYEYFNK